MRATSQAMSEASQTKRARSHRSDADWTCHECSGGTKKYVPITEAAAIDSDAQRQSHHAVTAIAAMYRAKGSWMSTTGSTRNAFTAVATATEPTATAKPSRA